MTQPAKNKSFLQQHSLSPTVLGVVILLIVLCTRSNPSTHVGSFFGNAIADWTVVFVTVVMTKFLYEKGSKESKQPKGQLPDKLLELLREHSLTIFLVTTGIGWVLRSGRWIHRASGGKWWGILFPSGLKFWGWC